MRAVGVLVLVVVGAVVGCSAGRPPDRPPSTADPMASISAQARAAHTMTALPDGDLLVTGGCVVDGCVTATDSAVLVTPDGDRSVAPMHQARDAHTATALADGRVLVVGGFSGEGRPPLRTAEVFDPATGRWTQVGSLATGRGGHTAALLGDGRVVVAGGWVGSHRYASSTELFDPATATFGPGPDLPDAADGLAAAPLPDGSVLVAGGQRSPGVASDQAVRIGTDGVLHRLPGLRTGRFKHVLVALPSGQVLVVGGTVDDARLLRSTEVYDPRTERFAPGPRLRDGRYKLAGGATVLPDGRVAVAGGGPGLEVLDPVTGTSREIGGRHGVASFSTVGVLGGPDVGSLLVLGGYDEGIRLTRTRQLVPLGDL